MGKKSKRRGVVWSKDPTTGSPMGREVNEWDGISRTTKRQVKKANIDQRRVQLQEASALKEPIFDSSFKAAYELMIAELNEEIKDVDELRERTIDLEIYHERLIDFLEKLRKMKRSAAKQRLVKHIYSSLEDEEWTLLERALLLAKQEAEGDQQTH